jgi:hypothetical protein
MSFGASKKYTFGYSFPDNCEIRLHHNAKDDDLFSDVYLKLSTFTTLRIDPYKTLLFPFDIPESDPHFQKLSYFDFNEWYLAAGIFNITEDRCFRVFLINKEDHKFGLVYDFGGGLLYAVAINGFLLMDQDGTTLEDDDIYVELGFEEEKAPLVQPAPITKSYPKPKDEPDYRALAAQAYKETTMVYPRVSSRPYDLDLHTRAGGKCLLNDNSQAFKEAEKRFLSIPNFSISPGCAFYIDEHASIPTIISSLTTAYNPNDWDIIAANFTPKGFVYNLLITNKRNPNFSMSVSFFYQAIHAVTTHGYTLTSNGQNYDNVTALAQVQKLRSKPAETATTSSSSEPEENKPIEKVQTVPQKVEVAGPNKAESIVVQKVEPAPAPQEPKAVETEPVTPPSEESKPIPEQKAAPTDDEIFAALEKEEEASDELFVKEKEAAPTLVPVRSVYATRRYLKRIDELKAKYHAELTNKVAFITKALSTSSKEELEKYLRIRKSIELKDVGKKPLFKFRVANSGTFQACRIFYTRGSDFGRGIEKDALVLLEFTETGEHDIQGKIGQDINKKIDQEVATELDLNGEALTISKELYHLTFRRSATAEQPSYSQYGVLSFSQSDLLKSNQAPCAFSGSAGTGKTLMSIDLYKNLMNEHPEYRILYLTYQNALKNQVQQSFDELGVAAECLTFKDLSLQVLGENTPYRDEEDFRRWAKTRYLMTPGKKKDLGKLASSLDEAIDIAYVFYRGIIEGSSHNFSKKTANLLSEDAFLKEVKDEAGFTSEQKVIIYQMALGYRDHIDRHREMTDNMCAEAITDGNHRLYDVIIVDETQDLTELQILAICTLLKEGSKQLYLFGDDNQAINPTIFTIENAAACLQIALGPGISVPIETLRGAYRSSNFLVNYINKFNDIKRAAIGANGQENDMAERSLRDSKEEHGSIPRLITDPALAEALFHSPATFASDTIVIVPSIELKEQLKQAYPEMEKDLVTIHEAKGREWDNAILYDFLSSSNDLWDAMLSPERAGKKSTLHRMLFNRFYVALTRARDRIIVVEDNVSKTISDALLRPLVKITKDSDIPQYLTDTLSKDDWYDYASRSFARGDLADADRCLAHIKPAEKGPREKALENDILLYRLFGSSLNDLAKGDVRSVGEFIECFIRNNDRASLQKIYSIRGSTAKIKLLQYNETTERDSLVAGADFLINNPDKFIDAERKLFGDKLLRLLSKDAVTTLTKIEEIHQRRAQ